MNTLTTSLPPELARDLDRAADLLAGRTFAVLTGAGVSTDSGIPDYRGEGAPKRTPMTFQQFLSDDGYRKRYWAGSHLGYRRFAAARPNDGHRALAALEAAGATNGVITQNVDGLHKQAGSRRVVDLHGAMDRVLCLVCGQIFAREAITARIDAANPWLDTEGAVEIAPDGDAIVHDVDAFIVPDCTVCGGHLKPDVVFFGEFIPPEKYREASALVRSADALMIAGSSLVVNSGIRLLEEARRRKLPIVIVNRGETKGDGRATVKLNGGTTETLVELSRRLA
ncbi:Sir2 family NAD-dependent protein deacetylase [Leifsonia sp. F6_8S_P_1B]|uniref:protein acetyllysine N-acetyltransferase n=1 Tax=Leifsonia williamsii TaxID=3035919 RepID=A0ABT8KDW9_9MICO|nr:Sir2 family NAD-dependent protein deacetylase [Leifsonia williamsii]MDN4615372.1 Sir2 family NAD-dependent protein deacetylase [Leifsonia williamsii]